MNAAWAKCWRIWDIAPSLSWSIVGAKHPAEANLWKVFSRYDQIAPGQAEVGMMHWAPNSVRDYDWGNARSGHPRAPTIG